MNFISIHDTHRLPYNNATITARTTQDGDTTPLEFFNAVDDEPLGFAVYTNARGYICDRDGNLYTKGVFVREDAYVTATLGDGASTSWIVRQDSDIAVNDGVLLGRIEDNQAAREEEEREGKEFLLFNGHWHLKLHSANTPDNRTLPLGDLDEVPAFNEWKEVEQVKQLKINDNTIVVEEYTKVLVIQWSGVKPDSHDAVDVDIDTQVIDGRHRYAQHCLVYNQTGMRLMLRNSSDGYPIGIVAPDGTMNMGLFFLESDIQGQWIQDDRFADWDNGSDATVDGGSVVYVEGQPEYGPVDNKMFEVRITDRTPNVLHIVARNVTFGDTGTRPGEIKIKLTAVDIKKARDMVVWFSNEGGEEAADRPAVFYVVNTDSPLFELYPATLTRIRIPATTGDFTLGNAPILLHDCDTVHPRTCTLSISGGGSYTVPKGCQRIIVSNTESGGTLVLYFQDEMQQTRVDVSNSASDHLWILCKGTGLDDEQVTQVCRANSVINFLILNSFRILSIVGDGKFSTISKGESGGGSSWTWFDMNGNSNVIKLNFHRAGYLWSNDPMLFGRLGNDDGDITVRVPLNVGETRTFVFDIQEYVGAGSKGIRLSVGLEDVAAAHSNQHAVNSTIPSSESVMGQVLVAIVTREENTVTAVWVPFESEAYVR